MKLITKYLISNPIIFQTFVSVLIMTRLVIQLTSTSKSICGVYCLMAQNYGELLETRTFDSYFLQKSLNSFVVYQIAEKTNRRESVSEINAYLLTIQTVQLLLFIVLWSIICKKISLHYSMNVLGLAMCLLNPIVFFYHFNYWEIPDASLLLLGISLAHAYITKSWKYMFTLYFVSWLIAPQVRILILLILLFWPLLIENQSNRFGTKSFGKYLPPAEKKDLILSPSRIAILRSNKLFIFFSFILLNLVTIIILNTGVIPIEYGIKAKSNWLWLFSVPIGAWVSSFLFLTLLKMASFHFSAVLNSIKGNFAVVLTVIFLEMLRFIAFSYLGQGANLAMTSSFKGQLFTLYSFFYQGISYPGHFALMTINTFGIGIILLVVSLHHTLSVKKVGLETRVMSLVLLILFPIYFMNTEARHLLHLIPIFILVYFREIRFKTSQVLLLMGLYLLSSRFYVVNSSSIEGGTDFFGLRQGPWASNSTFAFSLLLVLGYFFLIWCWFPREMRIFQKIAKG